MPCVYTTSRDATLRKAMEAHFLLKHSEQGEKPDMPAMVRPCTFASKSRFHNDSLGLHHY